LPPSGDAVTVRQPLKLVSQSECDRACVVLLLSHTPHLSDFQGLQFLFTFFILSSKTWTKN